MTKRAVRTLGWIALGAAALLLGLGSAVAALAEDRGPREGSASRPTG